MGKDKQELTFPIFIYHPVHAPTMPRSCHSQDEYDALVKVGWHTDGSHPSPIPPGAMPPVNADQASKVPPVPPSEQLRRTHGEGDHFVTDFDVPMATQQINTTSDMDTLDEIEKEEKANHNRQDVLAAVDARREVLRKGNAGAREEGKVSPTAGNVGKNQDHHHDDDDTDDTDEDEDDPSKELLVTDLNVADAKEKIANTTDLEVLKAIRKEEKANKDRVGVINAIDEQRDLIKNTDPNT